MQRKWGPGHAHQGPAHCRGQDFELQRGHRHALSRLLVVPDRGHAPTNPGMLNPPGNHHRSDGKTEHNGEQEFDITAEEQHRCRSDDADAFGTADELPVDHDGLQNDCQRQGRDREKYPLQAQGQIANPQTQEA